MKGEVSMPVKVVGGMIVVGAVVATAAVSQAYEVGQNLDMLLPGRNAAILHLVLRGAMKNAVLCAAFLIACWRYWRMPSGTWWKMLPLLLVVEIGAAVFAASSVARICSTVALRICPMMMEPFAALGGCRPFQVIDLTLLIGLILLFVAFCDKIERKIWDGRSKAHCITFAACLLMVFASPYLYRITHEFIERQRKDATEEIHELDPPKDDDYRIDIDEPWEMYAGWNSSILLHSMGRAGTDCSTLSMAW